MRQPVSPIFHGRDIFTPAAAYLSKSVKIEGFGNKISERDLVKAPYEEATIKENQINAKIISINKFGSLHLNIMYGVWDKFDIKNNNNVELNFNNKNINVPFVTTFGDVGKGECLIMRDDYGRVEIALNQDSFMKKYGVKIGDDMVIIKK